MYVRSVPPSLGEANRGRKKIVDWGDQQANVLWVCHPNME